jgi:hypothetical protein
MLKTIAYSQRACRFANLPKLAPSILQPVFINSTLLTRNMASISLQEEAEQHAHEIGAATKTAVNNWSHPGPAAFDFRSE